MDRLKLLFHPKTPWFLFAGSAVRNNLLDTGLINAFVDQGFWRYHKRREVMAIGACLVLLVAGCVLVNKWKVYEVEQLEKDWNY